MNEHGMRKACRNKDAKRRVSASDVKDMVKNVIVHLEQLHDGLSGVIGDLKGLISDIDNVTDRVEHELNPKSPHNDLVFTSTPLQSVSETPRLKESVTEFKDIDESPDLDLSYLQFTPVPQRPQWGRSLSNPVPRTPEGTPRLEMRGSLNAAYLVNDVGCELQPVLQTKPVARCYAQFKKPEIKTPNESVDEGTQFSVPSVRSLSSNDSSDVTYKEIIPKSTPSDSDTSYKEIIPRGVIESKCQNTDDVSNSSTRRCVRAINGVRNFQDIGLNYSLGSLKGDERLQTAKSDRKMILTFPTCSSTSSSENTPEAEVSYEREMENLLENLVDISSQSGLSDCDMDNNSGECTGSSVSEWNEGVNEVEINTWKSYALTHMSDSTKSSDSFLSDTPSDILNENSRATSKYGNMIFSDKLVILPSKHDRNKHMTF